MVHSKYACTGPFQLKTLPNYVSTICMLSIINTWVFKDNTVLSFKKQYRGPVQALILMVLPLK